MSLESQHGDDRRRSTIGEGRIVMGCARATSSAGTGPTRRRLPAPRSTAAGSAADRNGSIVPAVGRPSRTVTFMFTDIADSTMLWDTCPAAMHHALRHHDEILTDVVAKAFGRIFSTAGDGIAAVFATATDAVAAAVEAQRRFGVESWPTAASLRVRIGVHTGEAIVYDGGYLGLPVNTASRVMRAAVPGQVILSGSTAALLTAQPDVEVVDAGEFTLRGLSRATRLFVVRSPGIIATRRPIADVIAGELAQSST
jgi:class 3 adenylate cyclase